MRWSALALAGALVATVLAAPETANAATTHGVVWDRGAGGQRYVALGDSAAAGPLIGVQRPDPLGCLRSAQDFPTVAAKKVDVRAFTDVTCSGATTGHMTTSQMSGQAPQFDALKPDTTLVTYGPIGANDVALAGFVFKCLNLLPPPAGKSCQPAGTDPNVVAIDKLAPIYAAQLKEIRKRSPHAKIFVVGYGQYLPKDGCFPTQPIWPQDANYVQSLVNRVDQRLAEQAKRAGATYVNLRTRDSMAHTSCASIGQRWLEGLVGDSLCGLVPFHPSGLGMRNFGAIVAGKLQSEKGNLDA